MNAPSTKATSAPCHVGVSSSARPVTRSACPKVRTNHPYLGRMAPISFRRLMPSSGSIAARFACSSSAYSAAIWSNRNDGVSVERSATRPSSADPVCTMMAVGNTRMSVSSCP